MTDHVDEMAVVVDWLDCCRSRDLEGLLELYADDARLDCACEGAGISGRSALADYWGPKLAALSPEAFGLEEITPRQDGVVLDYLSFEGRAVRIAFAFDVEGRISHMRCAPSSR
ncbi:nuclear transport factor 2 family protein [Bradyrhizobium tropiciagri]|uniref:nuclear transport factor 2 family protein n=1 Tax=Bradyrhizobium tropiciagri TaxID=312253 RepID=UPI002010D4A0|nr:nuclear transport factor 2 family protein [Bradyrhizobium tropiciagri]